MTTTTKNYGPPAFPRPLSNDDHENPCNFVPEQDGMSLRDWFAGQALLGVSKLAVEENFVDATADGFIADVCFGLADAMMRAREKKYQ